jgi:hypothetical protein
MIAIAYADIVCTVMRFVCAWDGMKKKAFVRVGDRPMGIDVGKQTPGIEDGHDDWAMEPTAMPKTAAVTRKAIVHGQCHPVQEMHDGIGRGIDG